jgi:hypothetical protein
MNRSKAGKLGAKAAAKTCQAQYQSRINKYNKTPTLCKKCGGPIPYKKRNYKFCSQSCAAIYNNTNGNLKQKKCSCGDYFSSKTGNLHNKFCQKCIDNKKHLHIKINIDDCKTDPTRRRLLIKKHGIICFVCKKTEWNGQSIPIELDHIDGDSYNNIESNLRLICPNCHAQTPTYKGKNKGKGRFKRMERYNANKSF